MTENSDTWRQAERYRLVRDAARYRRLRENWIDCGELELHGRLSVIDAAVDAVLRREGVAFPDLSSIGEQDTPYANHSDIYRELAGVRDRLNALETSERMRQLEIELEQLQVVAQILARAHLLREYGKDLAKQATLERLQEIEQGTVGIACALELENRNA